MPDIKDLADVLAAGAEKIQSAQAETARQEAKLVKVQRTLSESQEEFERLLELDSRDVVMRTLADDPNTVPEKPKRQTRLRNLKVEIDGLKLAIPVQRQRCAKSKVVEQRARDELADTVLPELAELRLAAIDACRAPLNALLGALIEAAMYDELQERLVGRTFTISSDVPIDGLFRSTPSLTKLKSALTPRLQEMVMPDMQDVLGAVSRRTTEVLANLSA